MTNNTFGMTPDGRPLLVVPEHLLPAVKTMAQDIATYVKEYDPLPVEPAAISCRVHGFLASYPELSITALGIEIHDEPDHHFMLWPDDMLSGIGAAALIALLLRRQVCLELMDDGSFLVYPGRFTNFVTAIGSIPFLYPEDWLPEQYAAGGGDILTAPSEARH